MTASCTARLRTGALGQRTRVRCQRPADHDDAAWTDWHKAHGTWWQDSTTGATPHQPPAPVRATALPLLLSLLAGYCAIAPFVVQYATVPAPTAVTSTP